MSFLKRLTFYEKIEIAALTAAMLLVVGVCFNPIMGLLADQVRGITLYVDTTGQTNRIDGVQAVNASSGTINGARINQGQVSHLTVADTGSNTHTQIDGHISATGTSVHGLGSASIHADTEYEDAGAVSGHESTYNHLNYNQSYANWATIDRCGWTSTAQPSIQFDADTYTFTASGTATYLQAGVSRTMTTPTSKTVPDSGGIFYFYMPASGATTVDSSTYSWTLITPDIPIACVNFNPNSTPKYLLMDERHTSLIDRRTHWYEHSTVGTRRISGGAPTAYTYQTSTDTDSAKRYGIDAALIADEDLGHSLAALPKPTGGLDYLIFIRRGPMSDNMGNWKWKQSDSPYGYNTSTGFIEYDEGDGTLSWLSHNQYVNYYLALTNIQGQGRFILIPGQTVYSSAAAAYAETPSSLDLAGMPAEVVIVYQITYHATNGYSSTGKCVMTRAPQVVTTAVTSVNNPSQAVFHDSLSGITSTGAAPYYHVTADSIAAWDEGGGGHTIQADGVDQTQRGKLNFKSGFTVADNSGDDSTDISVSTLADSAFVNGNLSAGVLTVSNTNTIASVINDSGKVVIPDDIDYGVSSTAIDLSSYGALSGTWYVKFAQGLGSEGMTNPMTAAGDIIYGGTSGTPTRLAKGTDGQVLTLASGAPSWATASGGGGSDGSTSNLTADHTLLTSEIGYHFVYATSTDTTRTFTLCSPPINNSAPVWVKNLETSYSMTVSGHINGTAASTFTLQPNAEIKLISEGQTWRIIMERFTATADTATYTFSGLNGDVDRRYRLIARINENASTGYVLGVRLNGQNSTYYRRHAGAYNASFEALNTYSDSCLQLLLGNGGNTAITGQEFDATITAITGAPRQSVSNAIRKVTNTNTLYMQTINWGQWADTTTNITSMTFLCADDANWRMTAGSVLELWKIGELR